MLEYKLQHTILHAVQHKVIYNCVELTISCLRYVQIRAASSRVYVQSPARKAANGVLAACKLPKVSYKLRQQLAAALSNVLKTRHRFFMTFRKLPAQVR